MTNRSRCVLTMFAVLVLPYAAAAAVDPVRTCQEAIAKAGTALVAKVIRSEQACLRKVARGRLPSGTRCVGTGSDIGVIGIGTVRATVQRAIDGARTAIQAKCDTVDFFASRPNGLAMPPACPAIHPSCAGGQFDAADVIDCQLCAHVTAAHYLLGVQQPGVEATPDSNVPTPVPTATPHDGGTSKVVSFEIGATSRLQAFQFHVFYPGDKGRFRGEGAFVQCATDTEIAIFITNHQTDNAKFITAIASAGKLGLPTTIACTFDVASGQTIGPQDFTVVVDEVTVNNASGDPNDLLVETSVVTSTDPCLGGTVVVEVLANASYTDLALTIGYPAKVALPGTGAVDARVGVSPETVSSIAEDADGTIHVVLASNQTKDFAAIEVHFDCLEPVTASDLASFTCLVDAASNSGGEVTASCATTRLGFSTMLP
jgi:hypothetical protein